MAKPIKHELPEAHWPTAEVAQRSQLFSPIAIGPLTAATRSWVPAMVPWRATEDGEVTQNVIDWYGRFADGQPGVLVVEATGIRDVPSGPLLRIGHERFVDGLRRLCETVQQRSQGKTRLFLQILDFLAIRRRPEKEKFFARFLKITDRHRDAVRERFGDAAAADEASIRAQLRQCDDDVLSELLSKREYRDYAWGYRDEVNDLHLPHIRELPQVLPELFASAAERARAAGFDGVELHFAHAYTMASFLSRTNMRDDGYGGSPEARVRAAARSLSGGPFRAVSRRLHGLVRRHALPRRRGHRRRFSRIEDATASTPTAFAQAPASTSSRSARAASSTMPSGRRSAPPHIRTPALRVTSACQRCAVTNADRSGATCTCRHRSGAPFAKPA